MNTPAPNKKESTFRGYRGIEEVMAGVHELADWYEKFKPDVKRIHMIRSEWDLVKRWPKAAELHGVTCIDGVLRFRGFVLVPDGKPGRYEDTQ